MNKLLITIVFFIVLCNVVYSQDDFKRGEMLISSFTELKSTVVNCKLLATYNEQVLGSMRFILRNLKKKGFYISGITARMKIGKQKMSGKSFEIWDKHFRLVKFQKSNSTPSEKTFSSGLLRGKFWHITTTTDGKIKRTKRTVSASVITNPLLILILGALKMKEHKTYAFRTFQKDKVKTVKITRRNQEEITFEGKTTQVIRYEVEQPSGVGFVLVSLQGKILRMVNKNNPVVFVASSKKTMKKERTPREVVAAMYEAMKRRDKVMLFHVFDFHRIYEAKVKKTYPQYVPKNDPRRAEAVKQFGYLVVNSALKRLGNRSIPGAKQILPILKQKISGNKAVVQFGTKMFFLEKMNGVWKISKF